MITNEELENFDTWLHEHFFDNLDSDTVFKEIAAELLQKRKDIEWIENALAIYIKASSKTISNLEHIAPVLSGDWNNTMNLVEGKSQILQAVILFLGLVLERSPIPLFGIPQGKK